MKFTRRPESVATDWRQDPAVVKARNRLAEIDALSTQATNRITDEHAPRIKDAEAALNRAELEVLAGRATDAHLAAKQAVHLDARMAEAKDRLAIEDLQAEKRALAETQLPAIEKKARAAVHAAIQAKAVVLLKELKAHLEAAVQCEGDLAALRQEAADQFDSNIRQQTLGTGPNHRPNPGYDPDCQPAAGVPNLVNVQFDWQTRMQYATTIESRNATTLRGIDEALAHLGAAA